MLGGEAYSLFRKERKIRERKELKHFAFYLCIIIAQVHPGMTDGRKRDECKIRRKWIGYFKNTRNKQEGWIKQEGKKTLL
jgi:hypothetical protein